MLDRSGVEQSLVNVVGKLDSEGGRETDALAGGVIRDDDKVADFPGLARLAEKRDHVIKLRVDAASDDFRSVISLFHVISPFSPYCR